MFTKIIKLYSAKNRVSLLTIGIFYLLNIIMLNPVCAETQSTSHFTDFNMIYKVKDKSYVVNDAILPEVIGTQLPYSIYCNNSSKGGKTFEWFVKSPGEDYQLTNTEPNPEIKIKSYGPTYIKLRVNSSNELTKEYCVTSKEYGVSIQTEVNKTSVPIENTDVLGEKTIIKKELSFFSANDNALRKPVKISEQSDLLEETEFKISYQDQNVFYNVTNSVIPTVVNNLPYKVLLTNMSDNNSSFEWFREQQNQGYVSVGRSQNALVEVSSYGTTKFKLVQNGDASTAREYKVTALRSKEEKLLDKVLKKINSSKDPLENIISPQFAIRYNHNNEIFDVSNSFIPELPTKLPYTISLINLTRGENSYDFSIKEPGSDKFVPLSDFTRTIYSYGPVYVKLRINNNDSNILVQNVSSYFSTEHPDILNNAELKSLSSPNVKSDFKILIDNNGMYEDVTNAQIQNYNPPVKLYLSNLSTGNDNDEWFIKLPGKEYVPMSEIPNPTATVWNFGTVFFKLLVNGDKTKSSEYFVKIHSPNAIPTITSLLEGSKVELANLPIYWKQVGASYSYKIMLNNETTRKKILDKKLPVGFNYYTISSQLLEPGCKYSVTVDCLDTGFLDTVSFFTNGDLNISEKPEGGILSFETSVNLDKRLNIVSKINNKNKTDYFNIDLTSNSELTINLSSTKTKALCLELYDSKLNLNGRYTPNENGIISFSRALRKGIYYVKVFSREYLKDSEQTYKMNVASNIYNPKTMILFTGFGYMNAIPAKYPTYSDSDISQMLDNDSTTLNTKDFMILSNNIVCYGAHQALPKENLNKIVDSIHFENDEDNKIKEQKKNIFKKLLLEYTVSEDGSSLIMNPNFIPQQITMESFANESVELAKNLIEKNPNARIWFSFPAPIDSSVADQYIELYKEVLVYGIKNKLNAINPNYWRNNIVGYYYTPFDISLENLPFDINDNSYLNKNPLVKTMNALSSVLHNEENKLFSWITELDNSSENMRKKAYIVNANNIFDYVFLQPLRMFDNSGYYSKGIGSDKITIMNEKPTYGDELRVTSNLSIPQNVKVTVLGRYNNIVFSKEESNSSIMNFSFVPPAPDLYTIVITATNNNESQTFSKSIYIDAPSIHEKNIKNVLSSVKSNSIQFPVNELILEKNQVKKTSKTVIGFKIDVDAFSVTKPENIDFSDSVFFARGDIYNVQGLTSEESTKINAIRLLELNNFYRNLTKIKASWYGEYLRAFKPIRYNKPAVFYAGDRNELLKGQSFGIKKVSSNVYNAVRNFFLPK